MSKYIKKILDQIYRTDNKHLISTKLAEKAHRTNWTDMSDMMKKMDNSAGWSIIKIWWKAGLLILQNNSSHTDTYTIHTSFNTCHTPTIMHTPTITHICHTLSHNQAFLHSPWWEAHITSLQIDFNSSTG